MFDAYKGKRVFVTGHTGFKGSWLCEALLKAGAKVYGYALQPPTRPALFDQLALATRIAGHTIGDIRDLRALTAAMRKARPEVVFHLAAQPLVRESYRSPRETFDVNVMGTVNVLEAVRTLPRRKMNVVCITTDKVYENDNRGRRFKEGDPLGGSDPYSASKGACEIAIASYARSFFSSPDCPVKVVSARAGNVIGGGDWAADRIVPDAIRAWKRKKPLVVRNSAAVRPWQHVLEPIGGYLLLGLQGRIGAYNFGPESRQVKTVGQLVREIRRHVNLEVEDRTDPSAPREALMLRLNSTKARKELEWCSRWGFAQTVDKTVDWYRRVEKGESAESVCAEQLFDMFGE